MSHFSLKSLSFYGVAIGSVVVLFNVVTAYGESHLKAPPPLKGRYRLQIENPPECLQDKPLVLIVEQSGIYLHGLLLSEQTNTTPEAIAEEKPSLSGQWKGQGLSLSGSAPQFESCGAVGIEATLDKDILNGQLRFGSAEQAIAFAAKREATAARSAGHN